MNINVNERVGHEKQHGTVLSNAGAEDVWNWSSPSGSARGQRRAGFFSKHMSADSRCLEIGCGTGYFTRLVATTGADIIAMDISDELLDEARSKTEATNVRYENADVHCMPYDNDTFDVVFGSSILHHLEIEPALKECLRVLKPGGHMVFAEPNMLNPQIWAERKIPWLRTKLGVSPDETAFIRFIVARQMKNLGFMNIHVTPHEFLHPAIPENLIFIGQKVTAVLEKIPVMREIGGSVLIEATKSA